jgi:hypothetical protein
MPSESNASCSVTNESRIRDFVNGLLSMSCYCLEGSAAVSVQGDVDVDGIVFGGGGPDMMKALGSW